VVDGEQIRFAMEVLFLGRDPPGVGPVMAWACFEAGFGQEPTGVIPGNNDR
jgi:hypothetical protein